MLWVTAKVVQDIKNIPDIVDVHVHPQGGDVDTENLYVEVKGTDDGLWVKGFDPNGGYISDGSQAECPMVALEDGTDSDGGLQSDSEELALAYVRIKKYLRRQGWEVVRSLDPYF